MRLYLAAIPMLVSCNLFGPPAPASCERSSDCGDNERCRSGACEAVVPDCAADGDCNNDEFCENGECVECIDDRDCTGTDVCDDNECVAGTEGEGEEGEGEAPPPPPPDPDGPRILSISANQTTISSSSNAVIVSVVVTDPQGIEDVIGGTLLDPTSDATFGAFATSAAEGAYQINVTWDAINTVRSINFITTDQRTLRARFFDVAGNESFADLTITLTCEGEPACDGFCAAFECDGSCTTSLSSLEQCGACGVSCGNAGVCQGGSPLLGYGAQCACAAIPGEVAECGSGCIFLNEADSCGACNTTCVECSFDDQYRSLGCSCNSTADCGSTSEVCDIASGTCIEATSLRLDATNNAVMTINGLTKFLCSLPSENVGTFLCGGTAATFNTDNVVRNRADMVAVLTCPIGFTNVAQCELDNRTLFGCVQGLTVTCDGEPPPPPVGDIQQLNGYLEVDLNGGGFGPVCDDVFGIEEAVVACRQLGTPDASPTFTTVSSGQETYAMDNVTCSGAEPALSSCTFESVDDCSASEGVLVTCN